MESGRIRKLSVAVAVDGVMTPGADASAPPTYAPRSAEDLQRLTTLVRSAVGFDEARGDKVEVVNVQFSRPAVAGTEAGEPGMFDFQSGDIMRGAEIGAALIASLALMIFVLGPLMSGLAKPAGNVTLIDGVTAGALAAPGANGQPQVIQVQGAPQQQPNVLVVPGGQAALGPGGVPMASTLPGSSAGEPEPLIDVARIRGQVRASSTKKIGEVVEQHPEESAAIIRGWLNNAI